MAQVVPIPEPAPEERPVLVVDLGGQYSQLIARRIRECRVYSELVPHTTPVEAVRARRPLALVLSGGPASVYSPGAPDVDPAYWELGVPVLGICYGMQLLRVTSAGRSSTRAPRSSGARSSAWPTTASSSPGSRRSRSAG